MYHFSKESKVDKQSNVPFKKGYVKFNQHCTCNPCHLFSINRESVVVLHKVYDAAIAMFVSTLDG